jgi:hypothetical protein
MLTEYLKGNNLEHLFISRSEYDVCRMAIEVRAQPISRRYTPSVARHKAGKSEL